MSVTRIAVQERPMVWAWLVTAFVLAIVLAPVFSNQSDIVFKTLGRSAHLASLGLALAILCLAYGTRSLALLVPILFLFAIGTLGFRSLYLQLIYILFILAAMTAIANTPKMVERSLVMLVALCAVLMFLQVLGVGAWTQYFATHGIVDASRSVPKDPLPTLFLGYYEVQANFLQGRPAGIFHANQFASFVILMTMAVVLSGKEGRFTALKDGILCVAGVLSLSKAIALGIALFGVYMLFQGPDCRRRVFGIFGFYGIGLLIYAILFPGMFQIYFFNLYTFLGSILVRVSYALVHLGGFSEERVSELLSWTLANSGRAGMTLDTALREIVVSSRGGESLYSQLFHFTSVITFAALFMATLAIVSATFWNRLKFYIGHMFNRRQVLIVIALGTTGVAMNYTALPLFWFVVGLAMPRTLPPGPAVKSKAAPNAP